ncbi:MAG TPA: disulfide bond formation protein B [Acidimicrobiales bacterium]|nr:disulfide bond formation protein B [Acidimicrobiales bacterium]
MAVLALLGSVVLAGLVVGVAVPSLRVGLRRQLAGQGVALATVVALVATLGSLYLSEVADFPPCRLCWFQRIAMYPLVVVLGLGALRRDAGARLTGLVLAGLGLAVNLWHGAVEIRPSLEGSGCDPANPCSIRWVEELGFWTIPRMATVAFVLVLALLVLDRPARHPSASPGPDPRPLSQEEPVP